MKATPRHKKSKLNIYLGIFLCLSIFFGVASVTTKIYRKKYIAKQNDDERKVKQNIVFLMPHQDDEMEMAGAIKQYLDEGKNVYAVVISDGSRSFARNVINGATDDEKPVYCVIHKKYHKPLQEGYKALNRHDFQVARNKEFVDSMTTLGVSLDHIIFSNPGGIEATGATIYTDSGINKEKATQAISDIYNQLGDGTYITVEARKDKTQYSHPDHVGLQEALINFKPIKYKRFFTDHEMGKTILLSPNQKKIVGEALKAYYRWDPKNGRYAVGVHSVMDLLNRWEKEKYEFEI